MISHSILVERPDARNKTETAEEPDCFADLNLDQIVASVTAGKVEYNLKPFFYTPLSDIDTIRYRHEVMQDLQHDVLFKKITSFAQKMRAIREHLAQADKRYYRYQKESWFLEAVGIYCDAVNCLADDLAVTDFRSRGFVVFREYFSSYSKSEPFTSLFGDTNKLKADLSTVKYSLLIRDSSVKVRKYTSEIDYSADVEKTFEKFKQGAVKDYRVKFLNGPDINHVEAQILDFVAQLYPEIFSALDHYCAKNSNFLDETISVFDREIQFYIAYLEHTSILKREGLKFCYPKISNNCKKVYDYEGFDLALAYKLMREDSSVVCNDFDLNDDERIIVVSGPNQGGKTTFARTFGQLHYLAALGLPVPGKEARLFLFDRLFTHFDRQEDINNLRGKLQDDLVRIHEILNQASSSSIIIMNEIFASTTLQDALFLSEKIMEKIIELGLLCVWVTFIDELASFAKQTASMVSTIVPENPTLRTFKIIRRPADGLAYALVIAEKHGLTYDRLKERIKS
jgi:DNA mismatch repair protein MutS